MKNISKIEPLDKPRPVMVVDVGGIIFYARIEDNPSAAALIERLTSEILTVELHDDGHAAKVGVLPWERPRGGEDGQAHTGDVLLLDGNRIAVCYGEANGSFVAKIGDSAKERLLDALGADNVTVSFWLEWGE